VCGGNQRASVQTLLKNLLQRIDYQAFLVKRYQAEAEGRWANVEGATRPCARPR
jgi:hypothetical protein